LRFDDDAGGFATPTSAAARASRRPNHELTFAPDQSLEADQSQGKTWADEIVGVQARHRIDNKWSLLFEADAGGYSRSATAQVYGAVALKWNQYLTTRVAGRVLYVYYQTAANSGNGTFRAQETIWGPLVDTTFTF
jgi:hypothetical protein